jgi:pyruvate/2-oxoglutarate dehydrogenase complex dihydrolipoamide dehydrogenase (E3) component
VAIADLGRRLIPAMDGELSCWMRELFRKWGITVYFGSTAESIEARGDGLEVKLSTGKMLYLDSVLFAAGRVANTEGLGLEAARVRTDSRGRITVDRNFRTTADGIYAAGDVLGPTLAATSRPKSSGSAR